MGRAMHELREMLNEELTKISKSGDLTASKLDLVDKLTHSIKSIDTIVAMQEYDDDYDDYSYNDGYSNARGRRGNVKRDSMGRYAREGGSSYRGGMSYRDRGYARRDRYSRDDGAKEEAMQKLTELMNDTSDNNVRMAIQRAMEEMQ
jgi:hypothetical protein